MIKYFCYILLWCIGASCSPHISIYKTVKNISQQGQHHIGVYVYDPVHKKPLVSLNENKYFLPASNTKLLTLYSCLLLLEDSIPALDYTFRGDSLIFWGTGDPSFLYDKMDNSNRSVYDFLKHSPKQLYASFSHFHDTALGFGWSWEDFPYSFAAERSSFPIYGNRAWLNISDSGDIRITPPYFHTTTEIKNADLLTKQNTFQRKYNANHFIAHLSTNISSVNTYASPFLTHHQLAATLLGDTLKRTITIIDQQKTSNAKTLYSMPIDSAYRRMMRYSDNFVAEHLLLLCSRALSDTLHSNITINYITKNYLNRLSHSPRWVDGSGLSRYNLFTPKFLVELWQAVAALVPYEKLKDWLAAGGEAGTMEAFCKSNKPYLWGKTGTMSNHHTLSGYIFSKKGNMFIFSLMVDNHMKSTQAIQQDMEKIIFTIYENY